MKKNLLLIVLLMTLIPLAGYSQNETSTQFTVAGVIVDATGEPLVGTAVYVKNEPGVGVVADLDGKFKIKVTKNATLIFQSVGMKNVEMLITKNEEKLKIVMKEDETKIDEVVVTGMSSQKKVSVVGAITTIDVAQLKTPATSLNNMIGGRMAGVITMQSSGEPGKNISNFWIRGISTFGASSGALVLIDGLEGRLEDIDTDDVESFSILKDAAATAVYGTRGANGVVLVTTKRGTSGKLEVTGRATGRTAQGVLIKALRSAQSSMAYGSGENSYRQYYMEAKANWNRSFGDHTFGALLEYYMKDEKNSLWGKYDDLGIASIPKRHQNLSGRISYDYKNRYFIDANFGYTGSAQFKKGEQFGFFPSIAAGWVPSSYAWWTEKLPWFTFLKIRGSYGIVGNDQIVSTNDYTGQGRFPYLTLIDNHAGSAWGYRYAGITETHTGADNLKWEVAKKANLGIDAKFFHDKLSLTVDIFRDTRDHIFQDRVTLPSYVGMVTYPKSNVGRMHSVGSDGNIEFFHTINKDMSFTVRANYTFSQNIIDYFEENKLPYDYLSVTGRPFNILRGYISEGLFASKDEINTSPDQSGFGKIRPGDIKYRDVNGDGIINEDDKVPLSYSNQLPRVMYGFGGDFQWKDLTVSVLFKGSAKVDYYRAGLGNDNGWIPFYNGDLGNVIKLANNPKNRWTPAWYSGTTETENPNAEFPRLSYGGNKNNSQLSSFWRRNGSFLRLQEVSLRYSLKHLPWIKAVGLSSVDLEFVANNLCTFDNVKYFDPEQASANGAVYPIPATYSFQVYLRF